MRASFQFDALVRFLEEDAAAITSAFSAEQRQLLGERIPRDSDHGYAMWTDSDDPHVVAWKKAQRDHARRLSETGFHDATQLGVEVRDAR